MYCIEVLILLRKGLNERHRDTQSDWVKVDVIILQISWGNKENRRPREVLGQEEYQRRNERRIDKIEIGNIGKGGKKGYEDWSCRI